MFALDSVLDYILNILKAFAINTCKNLNSILELISIYSLPYPVPVIASFN